MVNINIMHVFKHPKYYEEMRQRSKKFQQEQKLKLEASSVKPQTPSHKRQAPSNSKTLEQDS